MLGGLADICIEYATKRYRSNCVNWGILPFTCDEAEINLEAGEYVYLRVSVKQLKRVQRNLKQLLSEQTAAAGSLCWISRDVTEAEKEVLLAGSLINFYKNTK